MGDRSGRNGHHSLTGAHFSVDDSRGLVFNQQQLIDCAYHIALCVKQLSGQAVHDRLVLRVRLAGKQRAVLVCDRIK